MHPLEKSDYNKRYRALHRQALSDYSKRYYQSHKAEQQQKARARYHSNSEGRRAYSRRYYRENIAKIQAYKNTDAYRRKSRVWYQKKKNSTKDGMLKRNYGIDLAEYKRLLESQNGLCAICGHPETGSTRWPGSSLSLAVDHDHQIGKVRGLLCRRCNQVIGRMGDDTDLLQKAIRYLLRG